jgi:hypothetical protein
MVNVLLRNTWPDNHSAPPATAWTSVIRNIKERVGDLMQNTTNCGTRRGMIPIILRKL